MRMVRAPLVTKHFMTKISCIPARDESRGARGCREMGRPGGGPCRGRPYLLAITHTPLRCNKRRKGDLKHTLIRMYYPERWITRLVGR